MSDYNNMEARAKRAETRLKEIEGEKVDLAGQLQMARDQIAALKTKYEPVPS